MKKSELRQIIREELKAMREAKPPLRGKVDGDKITYNHMSSRRHNITAAGNRKALPSQALLMRAAAESDLKSREDDYEMKTNELGHPYLEKKNIREEISRELNLQEALTVLDTYDDIAKEADTVLSGNRTFQSSVEVVDGELVFDITVKGKPKQFLYTKDGDLKYDPNLGVDWAKRIRNALPTTLKNEKDLMKLSKAMKLFNAGKLVKLADWR